jgi:biotin transport system substrate-specific component
MIYKSSIIALFASFICLGAYIRLPVGMTVIVFQNVLCIFFALILGGKIGILPTLLWLCAGLIGFPVFAGGQSGFVALFAQWGGFYLGYLLGAIIVVLIVKKPRVDESKSLNKNIRLILAFIAGMIVMYIPGVAWYGFYASKNSFIRGSSPEATSRISRSSNFIISAIYPPKLKGVALRHPLCNLKLSIIQQVRE